MGISQSLLTSSDLGTYVNTRDGGGTNITSTNVAGKQGLDVNVISSMGSVGVADQSPFTYGVSNFLSVGGVYNTSITALTAGEQGAASLTAFRGVHSNLRDSSGNELGNLSTNALFVQESYMQAGSGAISTPALSSSSSTLLAANALRKNFTAYNNTSFIAYCAAGASAGTGSFSFAVGPHSMYEPQGRVYTGVISVISTAGSTGNIMVTEYVS